MGGDSSGDEDDAVDFQAQVSQMLNPLLKKQKKSQKKLDELEMKVRTFTSLDSLLPHPPLPHPTPFRMSTHHQSALLHTSHSALLHPSHPMPHHPIPIRSLSHARPISIPFPVVHPCTGNGAITRCRCSFPREAP